MRQNDSLLPPPPGVGKERIIIVGGGVTGILSAWELVNRGYKVTVVEARTIGSGSSSRSAACIRQQFSTPSTVKGMIYSIQFYKCWKDNFGQAESPLKQNGYLFLKDYQINPEEVKETVRMQKESGLSDVEWLQVTDIEERLPYLETTGLIGATWCPSDGFLLPHIVYQDGAEAAKVLGVRIIQNQEVIEAKKDPDRLNKIKIASGEELEADIFINATNAWGKHVSELFGGYNLDIKPRRRYLYFLPGLADGQEAYNLNSSDLPSVPMTITPRGCYFRPDNKQLMMGWLHYTKFLTPTFDNQDDIEPGYGKGLREYGAAVRKEVTTYLPAAEEMGRIQAVTAGFYGDSPDHNPFIGYDPEVSNLIHVAGFSGHGLMHAPFSARIVAELVGARVDLAKVILPELGEVDVSPYWIAREFSHSEGMVI